MLPHTGWVTFRVRTEHDVPAAAQLLRLNYERLRGAHARTTIVPIVGQPSFVVNREPGDLPA